MIVPDVFSSSGTGSLTIDSSTAMQHTPEQGGHEFGSSFEYVLLPSDETFASAIEVAPTTETFAGMPSFDDFENAGASRSDVQALREQVRLIEQRMARPNERERDLEMVVGLLWQALARSGSTDAQPDSPLSQLVRRFVPNVLSTAQAPTAALLPQANVPEYMIHGSADPPLVDWDSLAVDQGLPRSSNSQQSDSGYGTWR